MNFSPNTVTEVAGLIVVAAIIATIVGSRNTAADINAIGSAFSNSIKAATGR